MTKNERERAKKHLYHQLGSANWFARFSLHGRQIRETTGTPDETEACRIVLARLDDAGADHSGGKKFVGPEQKRIKVQDLLGSLKVDYKLRGKASGARLDSNLKPLEEHFGHFRALELTSMDVDKFIEHAQQYGRRKKPGKPAKPASINRSLQLLRQSYKLAIRAGSLTSAPYIRNLPGEKDNARSGFFSDAEVRRVMANLPSHIADFVLFGYLVGWRKAEIASLLWDSTEGDIVRLRGQDSKNRESRYVTAETGELAELMARRRAARAFQTPTGEVQSEFIFHSKGEPIRDFRKSWATACKLAGVSGRLFHDLRRTAVREMIRSGIHESTARKISGHKTQSMLQRYNIQSETDIREAMQLRETRIQTQQQENRLAVLPVTKVVQ
jgi:integrase